MSTQTEPGISTAAFHYIGGRGIVPSALAETQEPPWRPLRVHVVFTDLTATEVALKRAVELAEDLGASTQVIVPHVVPYPLALDCPAVQLEFLCRRLQILAGSVGADPYIEIHLCRDISTLLRDLLPEGSLVVLSVRKRWPRLTKAGRLAQMMRKKGCAVVTV